MHWLFIAILVVVAGLVAAGGDRMGHRAARSKIRIGKLRPRTASTVIAVVTGVLISLVTFGVVFAVWTDFRDALLKYGETKRWLAESRLELEQMQATLDETEDELAGAQEEASSARQDLGEMRESLIEATKSISEAQQEFETVEQEVKQLRGERAQLKRDIDDYTDRMNDLRDLFEQLRGEVEGYQEGEIVMARGVYLAYQRVHEAELGRLNDLLQGALNRLNVNLSKDELAIAADAAAAAEEFITNYPFSEGDSLIVISAARNVFVGEDVPLAFEALPLAPLVAEGDVVMTVVVDEDQARIRMVGTDEKELSVPRQFDTNSLVDFTVAIHAAFNEGAQALGFLPDLRSGEIQTPAEALTTIAEDLLARPRPFVIQFVAKEPATAIDGLAGAEIYVSSPGRPVPEPEGAVEDTPEEETEPETVSDTEGEAEAVEEAAGEPG